MNREKIQELLARGGKITSSAAMTGHALFTIVDGFSQNWQAAKTDGVVAALEFTALVATIGLEEMCRRGSSGGSSSGDDSDGPNGHGGI